MNDGGFIDMINSFFGGAVTTLIGAFTGRLCCEEGFKHAIQCGLVHTRPAVTHYEPHGGLDAMIWDRQCQQ